MLAHQSVPFLMCEHIKCFGPTNLPREVNSMATATYSLNIATLHRKAKDAGHANPDGKLRLRLIGRHTGLDIGVVSRITRSVNRPDLDTVIALKRSYGGLLDDWVNIPDDTAAAEAA